MRLSNRLLLVLAALSGIAAWILVQRTPGIASIQVYEAAKEIAPGDILGSDGNLRSTAVSLRDFSSMRVLVPTSAGPLVEGRKCVLRLEKGKRLTLDHIVPAHVTSTSGSERDKVPPGDRYFTLSDLLVDQPSSVALAIGSDALVSVGYALEPDDVIDVVFPADSPDGGVVFENLKVLAVGGRAKAGWVTGGAHDDRYETITLAVPTADARAIASRFAFAGSAKPRTILYPRSAQPPSAP